MNKLLANIIFVVHFIFVIFILFGWLFPNIWYLYITALFITLLSEIILGYCPLSKFEFQIRKRVNPSLNYNYSFASYYTHRITDKFLSDKFVSTASYFLLGSLIIINIYFHVFYNEFLPT